MHKLRTNREGKSTSYRSFTWKMTVKVAVVVIIIIITVTNAETKVTL